MCIQSSPEIYGKVAQALPYLVLEQVDVTRLLFVNRHFFLLAAYKGTEISTFTADQWAKLLLYNLEAACSYSTSPSGPMGSTVNLRAKDM